MLASRVPRVYVCFVLIEALQLALLATVANAHVAGGGVVFMLLLLAGLAYGSGLAWVLLVIMNALPLLAIAGVSASSGGHTLWVNVAVMVLTGVALEAALLSRSMRRHIGSHRRNRDSVALS
jgi:hypothetical protein